MAWDNSATGVPDKGFGFAFKYLRDGGIIPDHEAHKLKHYYQIRNKIVHEYRQNQNLFTKEMVNDFKKFVDKYREN
jgi:uncharacterized protein YutE (UPF0331/DUF86 family)